MSTMETPKFESFETSSQGRRTLVNRVFLTACVLVSTLSVVILGVLLTAIILKALPTIGPHEDTFVSNNALAVVQGKNEGNDPTIVDSGDLVQGFFRVDKLDRGGLGPSNDLIYEATEENEQPVESSSQIGFYSFEIVEKQFESEVDVMFTMKAPEGDQSIASMLSAAGIATDLAPSTSIALLTCDHSDVDLTETKFSGSLAPVIKSRFQDTEQPSEVLAFGIESKTDFLELKLRTSDLEKMTAYRARKKAGQLNCLLSATQLPADSELKPVRVLSFGAGEIISGDAKIAASALTGIGSSQKKAGYLLGGELGITYCPTPEKDATALGHAKYFLQETPKSKPSEAGIGPAILGSIWVIVCCALFALPMGIGTAIFLEEFKPANRLLRFLHGLVQLNISNLAGVPSIVYGILGLTAFATMFGLFGTVKDPGYQVGADFFYQYLTEGNQAVLIPVDGPKEVPKLVDGMTALSNDGTEITLNIIDEDDEYPEDEALIASSIFHDAEGGQYSDEHWYYMQLPFGRGVLAASLTLMLVILPVIIIATQEALRAVPSSLREGAMGLGSTPWQVIRKVTLPAAIPSIMTGAILAMSRAIGEAAPILILCGLVFVTSGPQHLMDTYSVLPIQIYFWTGEPIDRESLINFQNVAAAGIVVLLAILLTFNAIAILIRQLTQKSLT